MKSVETVPIGSWLRLAASAMAVAALMGCEGNTSLWGNIDAGGGGPTAPAISATTPAGTQTGPIALSFSVSDPTGATVDITIEYSTDGTGGPFTSVMPAAGDTNPLAGVAVTASPTTLTFTWDSVADGVALGAAEGTVAIRIHVMGDGGTSTVITGVFTVDNVPVSTASVVIQAPTATSLGAVVTLDGGDSTGDGALTFQWTQLAGPPVTLSTPSAAQATFSAPNAVPVASLVFQLSVNDASGIPAVATATVTVFEDVDNRIFVVAAATGPGTAGTQADPFRTIREAIVYSDTLPSTPRPAVYVAGGTYVNDNTTGRLQLEKGLSFYGGFRASDWTRDVASAPASVISTTETPPSGDITTIDEEDPSDSVADVFDGFTVIGADADGESIAVRVRPGSLRTYANLTIQCGTAVGDWSLGLWVQGPGANPTVKDCAIHRAGTAAAPSGRSVVGIYVAPGSSVQVSGCTIDGGAGQKKIVGIQIDDGTAGQPRSRIENTTIIGGIQNVANTESYGIRVIRAAVDVVSSRIAPAATTDTGETYGILIDYRAVDPLVPTPNPNPTATFTLERNVITGGPGPGTTYGVLVRLGEGWLAANAGQAPSITNNVIGGGGATTGKARGIRIELDSDATTPGTVNIVNNTIDAGTAAANTYGVQIMGQGAVGLSANVINNIIFCSSTDPSGEHLLVATGTGGDRLGEFQGNLLFFAAPTTGRRTYVESCCSARTTQRTYAAFPLLDDEIQTMNGGPTGTVSGNFTLDAGQQAADVFVSVTPFDFHLSPSSPALDAGTDSSVTIDIDGDARTPGAYDIGVDEQ